MHNHKKIALIPNIYHFILYILVLLFWILLIFAFDDSYTALTTLCAIITHELAHKLAFWLFDIRTSLPLPKLHGFKIHSERYRSYRQDIVCTLAGPFSNVFSCLIGLPLFFVNKDAYLIFATVNLATALTNLLPIKGNDGYKLLHSFPIEICKSKFYINIIDAFSFSIICGFAFASLYLIEKVGEGYWMFGIFFFSLISEIKTGTLIKN